ncbi:methyltransferase domain-containing protein [Candidatus Woesearchaeota archaeon]|nr:methyltransferase domain-containing protein [Candidatus Woesearchaeota archaeon]
MKKLKLLSIAVTLTIFYFLIKALIRSYNSVVWSKISLDYGYIALSFAFLVIGYLMLAYNWREVLLSMHQNISLSVGIWYWCISQFAKFLPGNIWFAVGRAYLTSKAGIEKHQSIISIFIESILMVLSSLFLGSLLLFRSISQINGYIAYIMIAILCVLSLHPKIIMLELGLIGRFTKIRYKIDIEYKEIFFIFLNYLIAWFIIGIGFAFFVKGIASDNIPLLSLAGIFAISWLAGFIAFIVPSGLGVRESIMAALLSSSFEFSFALIIAFAARLWWIVGELIAWPLSYAFYKLAASIKNYKVKNIGGNYFDKYNSKNPLVRLLMWMFFKRLFYFISKTGAKTIVDVGCGEGYVTAKIHKRFKVKINAYELEEQVVKKARRLHPEISFRLGSIYHIREKNNSNDLVIASEVLEHVYDVDKAINELKRVSRKYVMISVPNEPLWRLANILRFRYLKQLGNTPGHVQNFSKKEIRNILIKNFKRVEVKSAGLWTIALCEK